MTIKQPPAFRREGSIVHETAIAMVLACALMLALVQVVAVTAQQTRSLQQQSMATLEAGDLMEQLMARSWDDVTPETTASIVLSEACQATLPRADLSIDVTAGEAGAKKLSIHIAWQRASGQHEAPVHLVAWKYPRRETSP